MPQDYSGQNLRGRNFKGKNLEGANFSEADIRSADFTGAKLKGASFSHAKAGLQKRWATFLVLFSWLLVSLSGFLSTFAGVFVALLVFSSVEILYQILGWTVIVILVGFFFIAIRQGIQAGLGAVAIVGVGTVTMTGAFAIATGGAGVGAIALAYAASGAFAVAGAIAGAIALAIAGGIAGVGAVAGAIALAIAGGIAGETVASRGSGGFVASITRKTFSFFLPGAIAGPRAIAAALLLFSIYISWRALKGDPKHTLIRDIAVAFAAFKGTSFRSADLTDADFTQAALKSTDFRKANLIRTCWRNAKKLDRVRPGTTYLQNALLLQVLVTGRGEKQIFDQKNLRGVNLQAANLQDASFIATYLSEANLKDADLSKAKLVQTQLDQTDLTGAILTGAYIEEWNISTDTKLHGVRCDYVFMRLPPEKRPDFLALPPQERLDDNPRRKPDDWNRNFVDDEFADFIAPLVQTLDLYHNKVVDPRFIAIAFQQLKEAHPEAELEIISIEKKGKNRDKINIKAETSLQANSSTLHADYFSSLEYLQSLPPEAQQALLVDRGAMIRMLAGLLGSSSTPQPEIYIVNNNSQSQDNKNQNEHGNINTDGGNYNEDIQGNYIEGDYSEN